VALDPDEPLRSCPEQQVGVSLPTPLNARLDALVRRATAAGENTSRKEVLAALVFDAVSDPDELSVALRRYRKATAKDAKLPGEPLEDFLEDRERKPGPRPRR
jgi:hypothetical protein